jgi:uncharacterized protein (PEP-CTERM system associated)
VPRRCGRSAIWIVAPALALTSAFQFQACAQTDDYFATPWVVSPLPSQITNPGAPGVAPAPVPLSRGTSSLYTQAVANHEPSAPPVLYSFSLGIDEIGTDNVGESETHRTADLSSLFSVGGVITADTERLTGELAATGVYERNIVDADLDQFTEYGYGDAQVTIIPQSLFLGVSGLADTLSNLGGGLQNPVLQSTLNTHFYTIGGSPYWATQIDDFGINVLRYELGQAWFSNVSTPVGPLGFHFAAPTSSTDQSVREDFRSKGTIVPKLMSDFSLSGTENDSGNSISGLYQQADGESINEYEITRSMSLIGGAGFEILHDPQEPEINGQDPIWDMGSRIRPNADSSILLVYGRHSRKTDFSGEVSWQLTPFTSLYAAYSDSISTAQQTLISNTAASVIGPAGAVSGVTFDQSTLIGVLDDTVLNGGAGNGAALGIPIGISNNFAPLQNGLFRTKQLSATVQATLGGNPFNLAAYSIKSISFTPLLASSFNTEGANLSWLPAISPRLSALALAGYAHVSGGGRADTYNGAIGATYLVSDSLSLIMRYDFILRKSDPSSTGYLQDAVTIALHKSFN